MGTPEDVAAEKYFTPPTLTEMLKVLGYSEDIELAKRIFKEWLRTIGLGDLTSRTLRSDIVESTRKLLITLVDEQ